MVPIKKRWLSSAGAAWPATTNWVLMNFTLAGPVCSLASMFAAMEARRTGLLGLDPPLRHEEPTLWRPQREVPEHLQSHFLAVRAPLFAQRGFLAVLAENAAAQKAMRNPLLTTRHDSPRILQTSAAAGIPTWIRKICGTLSSIPSWPRPRELLANRGCLPFFQARRSFFYPYADELRRTDGTAAPHPVRLRKTETNFTRGPAAGRAFAAPAAGGAGPGTALAVRIARCRPLLSLRPELAAQGLAPLHLPISEVEKADPLPPGTPAKLPAGR